MAQTQYTGKNALTYIFTIIKQYVTGQLANKVDKDGSKVLSTNDYTTEEKNKLAAIEASAQVNKIESVKVNNVALKITDKAVNVTVPTKVSELQNDSSFVTSATHTSDLALKQDKLTAGSNIRIEGNIISATGEILNSVAWDNITGDLNNNTALKGALDAKANASDLTAHTGNANIHVTSAQKTAWDAKLDAEDIADLATKAEVALKANSEDVYTKDEIDEFGYQNASQVSAAITSGIAGKADTSALTAHTGNSEIHVTASDKNIWNGKTTMAEVEGKGYQTSAQVESAITAKGYQTASQVNAAISGAVADITSFEFQVVEDLPGSGEKGIIYLVAHAHGEGDGYDEYIWVNTAFEKIGNTDIDLSGYVLSSDLVEITNEEVQQLWDGVFTA